MTDKERLEVPFVIEGKPWTLFWLKHHWDFIGATPKNALYFLLHPATPDSILADVADVVYGDGYRHPHPRYRPQWVLLKDHHRLLEAGLRDVYDPNASRARLWELFPRWPEAVYKHPCMPQDLLHWLLEDKEQWDTIAAHPNTAYEDLVYLHRCGSYRTYRNVLANPTWALYPLEHVQRPGG